MKKVFSSHEEVAHVWAQQTQDEGRAGNIFFDGSIIYSYGKHYAIANFVKDNVVLINSSGYSVSTAKHTGIVSRAVSHIEHIFYVPEVRGFNWSSEMDETNHKKNIAYFIEQIQYNLKKAAKARTNGNFYLSAAQGALNELHSYTHIFELAVNHEYKDVLWLADNEDIAKTLEAIKQKELERERKIKEENKEKIQAWINNEPDGYVPRTVKHAYLRIKDNVVETSQGARVDLKEAKLLYLAIKHNKDIKGQKIGYYTVLGIQGNNLKVGCHTIPLSEVNRIGVQL